MSDQATQTTDRAPEAPETPEPRPALPPIAYPLLGLVGGAILVWSFSRVLLALGKLTAAAVALVMALNILVGSALVAYGSRVRRRPASFPLLVLAAAAVVGIGVVAAPLERQIEEHAGGEEKAGGPGAVTLHLVAEDIAWDTSKLSAPAGGEVTLELENGDEGIPHNFALYEDEAMTQSLFTGETFNGVATREFTFSAPSEPGTYHFRCDVHPTDMVGTMEVTAGGEGEGGGGPVEVVGKDIRFQPAEVEVAGEGQVTIEFNNQDQGIPHNISVFRGKDENAPVVFTGETFSGPATKEYAFEAPPPGRYFFRCDVHPTEMTGTLVVR